MHKRKNLLMLAVLVILIVVGACKKYPEGPFLSFRSPESRLVNTWQVDKATESDGDDVTSSFDGVTWEFKEDNTFIQTVNQGSVSTEQEGTWELINDKKDLYTRFEFSFGGVTFTEEDTSTIQLLKNKELWIESSDGTQVQFSPA